MYTPMVYNVTLLGVNRRDVYVVNFQWYVDWAIPHPYPLVQELQHLPFLPSEVLPLFLYLGDRRHAYNAAMNYDLKIHAHVNMGGELHSAFPGAIAELHIDVEDSAGSNLLERFEEICKFLESRRKKSERVLVFSELGISRAATAAIAYLIKGKQWSLKVRIVQTNQCRGFCASRVTLAGCEQ